MIKLNDKFALLNFRYVQIEVFRKLVQILVENDYKWVILNSTNSSNKNTSASWHTRDHFI